MEFIHEGVALGVDLLILGLCVKEYISYKKNVQLLKVRKLRKIKSTIYHH